MNTKILVIDDTKNIRLMLSKCLSMQGYDVDTADNGHDGIELFKQHEYHIVMLDIRMPQMSGTEVLRAIKEIKHDVSVIIITAFPTIKNAVECIKMGAVDYLRKPFTPDKIKKVIEALEGRKNISPGDTDSCETAIQYAKKCIVAGKLDEAAEYLRKAISINIDDPEPFILLGNICESKCEYDAARKYYNIALQLQPESELAIENVNRINNKDF